MASCSSTKTDSRPAFQFYPDDWTSEAALKLCSLAARGLWAEMMCIMFRSPERGRLLNPNGSKTEAEHLAKFTGCPIEEVSKALAELDENAVYSTDDDGVIYSRRMVREEASRQAKIEAGRKGGSSKTQAEHQANAKQNASKSKAEARQNYKQSGSKTQAEHQAKGQAKRGSPTPTPTPTPTSTPGDGEDARVRARAPRPPSDSQIERLEEMAGERETSVAEVLQELGIEVLTAAQVTRVMQHLKSKQLPDPDLVALEAKNERFNALASELVEVYREMGFTAARQFINDQDGRIQTALRVRLTGLQQEEKDLDGSSG